VTPDAIARTLLDAALAPAPFSHVFESGELHTAPVSG